MRRRILGLMLSLFGATQIANAAECPLDRTVFKETNGSREFVAERVAVNYRYLCLDGADYDKRTYSRPQKDISKTCKQPDSDRGMYIGPFGDQIIEGKLDGAKVYAVLSISKGTPCCSWYDYQGTDETITVRIKEWLASTDMPLITLGSHSDAIQTDDAPSSRRRSPLDGGKFVPTRCRPPALNEQFPQASTAPVERTKHESTDGSIEVKPPTITTPEQFRESAVKGNAVAAHLNTICGLTDDGEQIANPTLLVACPQIVIRLAESVLLTAEAAKARAGASCKADDWYSDFHRKLLEQQASHLARASKLAIWMRTSAISVEGRNELPSSITEAAVRIFRSSADVELSFGDAALKAGCVDVADAKYRGILTRYHQDFMSSHRQRAQVGIDDARAKRSAILCRLVNYC
jgi:hypothetical protein